MPAFVYPAIATEDRVPLALRALGVTGRTEVADLPSEQSHLGADPSAIQFDLGLTGATGAHSGAAGAHLATGLAAHRIAPAAQTRQQVFELGQLDLGLALAALRVLAEDVEDHRGPVDDLDLDDVLECATLARCELGVGDDGVGSDGGDDVLEFLGLASAEVGRGIGVRTTLQHTVEHDRTSGLRQRGEFPE